MRVQVIQAWPRRHRSVELDVPQGTTVGDVVNSIGLDPESVTGYAVFGERAAFDRLLQEGDRVEMLRELQMDPKEARRRRATQAKGR